MKRTTVVRAEGPRHARQRDGRMGMKAPRTMKKRVASNEGSDSESESDTSSEESERESDKCHPEGRQDDSGQEDEEEDVLDSGNGEEEVGEAGDGDVAEPFEGKRKMKFVSGRGIVVKQTWNKVEVQVKYGATSSVLCPCEKRMCKVKIRIGKFGRLGDGQKHCPHCGKTRGSAVSYFSSKSDMIRHLGTASCQRARGILPVVIPSKQKLGDKLAHEVSNPDLKVVLTKDGEHVNKFKCPLCGKLQAWAHRYDHSVLCYPKHGKVIG